MANQEKYSYEKLAKLSKRTHLLKAIEMLLGWDQETYMPKGAAEVRAESSELLAGIIHNEKINPEFKRALASQIDLESGEILNSRLSDEEKASVREMRRDFLKQVKLPQDFVEEFAAVTSAAHHAWIDAREHNHYATFQPHFEKIVELNQRRADYLGYDDHPYDALMDCFEPDTKTADLKELFYRLKIELTSLLKELQNCPDPAAPFFEVEYDHDTQLAMGKMILKEMGFSDQRSRLDESIHPMCIPMHPHDMRMTTRIYPMQVYVSILSCAHEGGHGLYHTNLPPEKFGTPLCEAASYGIDESQSRTWETIIGRSIPFLKYFYPKFQKAFPKQLEDVPLDSFYRAINVVEPSLIRVDSDEVSYNLHILIRFEIEVALLEGKLKVSDVPEAWNEKMLSYLNIIPKTDSEGCLQDIHWSMGAIGYFPTYTLGNLYSAQFFETFAEENPSWSSQIEGGNFKTLAMWQKEKIHKHGRRYLPHELCQNVTGKSLSEEPFIRYLKQKYSTIYNLK